MRKYYGSYFKDLPGFKQFRIPMVTTTSPDKLLTLLDRVAEYYARL